MMLHFSSLTTARFQLMVTLLKLAWQDQNFLEVWLPLYSVENAL